MKNSDIQIIDKNPEKAVKANYNIDMTFCRRIINAIPDRDLIYIVSGLILDEMEKTIQKTCYNFGIDISTFLYEMSRNECKKTICGYDGNYYMLKLVGKSRPTYGTNETYGTTEE